MCPLLPFNIIFLYLLIFGSLWFSVLAASKSVPSLRVLFNPKSVDKIPEESSVQVSYSILNPEELSKASYLYLMENDRQIAEVTDNREIFLNYDSYPQTNYTFNVTARFLGYTSVKVKAHYKNGTVVAESEPLPVSVKRKPSVLDKIFVSSVATFVSIAYINMGCTIDLSVIKQVLLRPIGPVVGLCCQYMFMPLVAFGLGLLLFPSHHALQLGLFVAGCSPGGGASNIWTFLLGGNLNLSLTMTFLSTLAAFATMPAWIFSLGRVIFNQGHLAIPYKNIFTLVISLVVPIGIGVAIKKYLPKVANFLVRILKPLSAFLILYIVGFGVYANLYIFKLFSWQIILGGIGLPWLGYLFGVGISKLLKFDLQDVIAISIETGVQNTGVAILLLRLSLDQPDADMTTAIPIAVAIMTPFPLLAAWLGLRLYRRNHPEEKQYQVASSSSTAPLNEVEISNNNAGKKNGHILSEKLNGIA